MKVILTAILFYSSFFRMNDCENSNLYKTSPDTTEHEKFILAILNDYEQPGQWMFIQLDSCDKIYPTIVEPIELFKSFSQTSNNLDKKQFIWLASEALKHHETIYNCPSKASVYGYKMTTIDGKKINKTVYKKISKKTKSELLNEYFNSDRYFKQKYKFMFYEIVAACYDKNIRIITDQKGESTFKIYE